MRLGRQDKQHPHQGRLKAVANTHVHVCLCPSRCQSSTHPSGQYVTILPVDTPAPSGHASFAMSMGVGAIPNQYLVSRVHARTSARNCCLNRTGPSKWFGSQTPKSSSTIWSTCAPCALLNSLRSVNTLRDSRTLCTCRASITHPNLFPLIQSAM